MTLIVVLLAITATTFTSCVTQENSRRVVDYQLTVSQDLLDLCDVTIYYKDLSKYLTLYCIEFRQIPFFDEKNC